MKKHKNLDLEQRNYDTTLEYADRRNKGQFYTPKIFVDYAHSMLTHHLGTDWKEQFVVWDNCCGTKNLTRDYKFKELYCSTLEQYELDASSDLNPEATSFQFDFLNSPLEDLPKGLLEAFQQNKKILFLLNPPYSGNKLAADVSKCRQDMKKQKFGICSRNILSQFYYRMIKIKEQYNLTNLHICIFAPRNIFISPSFQKLRYLYADNFKCVESYMFPNTLFTNLKANWAITLSLFVPGKHADPDTFVHKLLENKEGTLEVTGEKLSHTPKDLITTYCFPSRNLGGKHTQDLLVCTNIKKMEFQLVNAKIYDDYLAAFNCYGNDVCQNNLSFINNFHPAKVKMACTKNNLFESCVAFSIRKPITPNWIIDKDQYNMNNPIPEAFQNDCLVYAMFGNYCCSIRYPVPGRQDGHSLNNEFFWMSKTEIEDLANTHNNDDCYSDVHTAPERFVYQKLQTITLSPEAQAVYDKACEIVRKTFKYRPLFDAEHPEYQINNWDCGWYQIKALAKEYAKNDLDEFKKLYKELANKMRPMVWVLGFLPEPYTKK